MLEESAKSSIVYDLSNVAKTIDIHAPIMEPEPIRTHTAQAFEIFPYALIVIAFVILILGVAGIIYICVSWSR